MFAFGFDSYRLAVALRDKGMTRGVNIDGLTGRLSLDADGRVHRDLNWAQLHNGELKLLPEPTAVAAPTVVAAFLVSAA